MTAMAASSLPSLEAPSPGPGDSGRTGVIISIMSSSLANPKTHTQPSTERHGLLHFKGWDWNINLKGDRGDQSTET